MDPLVILSALAAVTQRIGLIGTASTSYDHPFHLARRFASLDHISKGRAGWNIVTSSNPLKAYNFGLDAMPDHAERYARASDVTETTLALWDSWQQDARIADKQAGLYLDSAKVRRIDHDSPFVPSRGPLKGPRSTQGLSILAQAGASEAGRDFAARYADMVFTVQSHLAGAQAFYRDMKARAASLGRAPESLLIYPGIVPIAASTRQQAEDRLAQMNGFMVIEHLLVKLSEFLGADLSQADLDAPLPGDIGGHAAQNQASQSRVAVLVGIAQGDRLSLRPLLMRLASGRGHLLAVGTGADIQIQCGTGSTTALQTAQRHGPCLPGDLASFIDVVIPKLAERKLFAVDHQPTLRQLFSLSAA